MDELEPGPASLILANVLDISISDATTGFAFYAWDYGPPHLEVLSLRYLALSPRFARFGRVSELSTSDTLRRGAARG